MRNRHGIIAASWLALVAGMNLPAAADSEYTLEVSDKAPPADLGEAICGKLAPKMYTISDGDGVLYEFWFAKEVPLTSAEDPLNVLNNIPEITLLGAANIPEADRVFDFREDPVDPGLKTMRMAYQPQDGNHMGTAPLNTFAILMPHDRDSSLDAIPDHDALVEMSAEGTIAEHPPILYLEPATEGDGNFPRLAVGGENGREWQIIEIEITAHIDENKEIKLPFGLVFEGIGDL